MLTRNTRVRVAITAPRPQRVRIALSAIALFTICGPAASQEAAPLTLEDAMRRAAGADPRLSAARAGVEAAEAGRLQARARPNPVLEVEAENFGGQGVARGYDSAETTLRVSQSIERGGRRLARIDLSDSERRGAELDARIAALDVFAEVQRAYFAAAATMARAEIAVEQARAAEDVKQAVDRRVAAARDPLMAGARAAGGLAEARLALARAQQDAAIAVSNLASLTETPDNPAIQPLGDPAPHAHEGDFPDVARARLSAERVAASVRVERARGYSDPAITLGVRRFEQTSDTGLVAGFSMPLGVFDRNAGAIAKARAEERRANAEVEAVSRRVEREKQTLERQMASLFQTIAGMDRDVIPQAERSLALARQGYALGGFSYLDVLDAQRALIAVKSARIDALLAYHNADAALDRLSGRFAYLAEGATP